MLFIKLFFFLTQSDQIILNKIFKYILVKIYYKCYVKVCNIKKKKTRDNYI